MRNFAFVFTLIPVWLVYFLLDEKGYRLLSFVVPTLMAVIASVLITRFSRPTDVT